MTASLVVSEPCEGHPRRGPRSRSSRRPAHGRPPAGSLRPDG